MKITILANKDIAANVALNLLLPQLSAHEVRVFLSSKVGGNGDKPAALKTLAFFEQTLFNERLSPLLSPLLAPEPGSGRYGTFGQFDDWLQQPVATLNRINSADGLATIGQSQPDVIISIRYGGILKAAVIAIPRFGVINLHSGLLPHYRGVMATFWALLHDEKTIGTTLHTIDDSGIDSGDIIAQSRFGVDRSKSYLWHVLQLYHGGCELILNAIDTINAGSPLVRRPQPQGGHYFGFPTTDDLLAFADKGLVLVDEQEIDTFIKSHYFL